MIIQWIFLFVIVCFIGFFYFKGYKLKTKLLTLMVLMLMSLILTLPIFPFSFFTLLGLFLFERIWIILALVLIIEVIINKEKRIVKIIFSGVFIIIYFFLRRFI